MSNSLFSPLTAGSVTFRNRIVMAPMTRSRATANNVPTPIMADYYGQRADGGLLITEGTSPSPNGVGYSSIPGIYNDAQIEAWKKVTATVHEKGGKIFMQIMHTGRIGHEFNLPEGAKVVGPSAVQAAGQMYTPAEGMKDHPVPHAMSLEEVKATIAEFVAAAKNAVSAGFDGIELHAANGYLIEQFINPHVNTRADEYGGSIEGRSKFLLDIAEQAADAIGAEKVGVRFSPYGGFNDIPAYDKVDETYAYLAKQLNDLDILYVHVLDHSSAGAPPVPQRVKDLIRERFDNLLIVCGGFDRARAEQAIENGADLVAFGSTYLANPDLVTRLEKNAALNTPDMTTFYTPGEKGYTDYPLLAS